MSTAGAAAGAAAAAAAAQLLLQQEEEELTKYTDADLQGEWEFKILRSNLNSFAKPEILKQVCDEEARAGWVLLEKFDNQRLRFKRPISARARDAGLEFDPYRTLYGTSSAAVVLVVVFAMVFGAAALVGAIFLIAKR